MDVLHWDYFGFCILDKLGRCICQYMMRELQCCGQGGQTRGGPAADSIYGPSLDIDSPYITPFLHCRRAKRWWACGGSIENPFHHPVSAMQAGEAVVGVRAEQGAVEAATAALAARARERATRVRLVWRYAGRAVEAAGPLLGGWGCRVSLHFCPREGCWAAEVQVHAAPVTL